MSKRIVVLDRSPKVAKQVDRATRDLPNRKVEGHTTLKSAKDALSDALRFDIRVILIGCVVEGEKVQATKWAEELYLEGYDVFWFSEEHPPVPKIQHIVRTHPFDGALEKEIGERTREALDSK